MTRKHFGGFVASIGLAALVLTQSALWAQVAPYLGTAQQFGVLGNSGVTGSAGAGTVVNGHVGSYPTGSITNFPPSSVGAGFTLHTTANATVQQAQTDARSAYNSLAAQGGTTIGNSLSGTLGPGVYAIGAADLPASTTLTLNGSGIFIFNVASTLTMNGSSVVTGTADPCNVYWRVGTSATLNGTSFIGTVLADASISLGGGTVSGRLLAGMGTTGAVTMASGGNTIGGCSQALVTPTITKAFSPTSISAGGVSTLTITLSNSNSSLSSLTAALTDTLPTVVRVAATPNASTTCGSGGVTATAGGSTVSLASGSTIPGSGSCTVSVNVTAAGAGSFVNTIAIGALQTSSGNNPVAASATLAATCPVITLAPATLPNGTVGVAYSQTITGSGGTAPYSFTVQTGTLPAGLTLTTTGVLAGTPTAAATSTFTVRGTDANGCFADLGYTIIIAAAPVVPPVCPVISLAPATLPNGTIGVAYTQTITGSGGTAPYSFGVTVGTLPAGLTLTAAGVLAGTPTTVGTSTFTIRGTDANGCFAELAYTIVVAAAPVVPPVCPVITLTPATLATASAGVAWSQTVAASGGTAPYVFGVTAGALPPGLLLTNTGGLGLLSGTPTTAGTSTFTIRGTDANGCFAEIAYVQTITALPGVPTMSQWALIALGALLLLGGALVVRSQF